jgi:hypothetical protein
MPQHAEEGLLGQIVAVGTVRNDARAESPHRLVVTTEQRVECRQRAVPQREHEFFVRRFGHPRSPPGKTPHR